MVGGTPKPPTVRPPAEGWAGGPAGTSRDQAEPVLPAPRRGWAGGAGWGGCTHSVLQG